MFVIKRKLILFSLIISTLLFFACSSFIKKEEEPKVKEFEKGEYSLLQDAGEGDRFIKKGEKVKLYIIIGDNYIKVFCYSSKIDFVKAQRALLLYVFEEDFEKSKFSLDYFKEKLFSKISPVIK
jgi:type II secretion system-associated lipoprotein